MGKEKSEKVDVHGPGYFRLKHSGLYDLHSLLQQATSWLLEMDYIPSKAEHTESVKSSGKDIKIIWTPFRNVTEYLRFSMTIEFLIFRQIDVVVEEKGGKAKRQQGDLEIRYKSEMVKNYRQTFRGAGKELARQTYEKYLIKRELEEYEEKLRNEGDILLDHFKRVLGSFRR